jgi:formylglycine-generating enzyme required for sulfatase activity
MNHCPNKPYIQQSLRIKNMYRLITFNILLLCLWSCENYPQIFMKSEMILIKGGYFVMTNEDYNSEKTIRSVRVKDFYISKTEVTVGQYRKCVDADVCSKADTCNWGTPNWTDKIGDKENHPINCVDWNQARTFARWVGGDLPSEAQWEYASRSEGKDIKYPWGNAEATCSIANFEYSCHRGTTPICSKIGDHTIQGVCDMGGNIVEWVLDESHLSYSGAPSDDIGWCSNKDCNSNLWRIFRGGSWHQNFKSPNRLAGSPSFRFDFLGFRVSSIIP